MCAILENNTIFALDIGTRSIIGVVVEFSENNLKIKAQYRLEHTSRAMYDGQIHDIPQVATSVIKVKETLEKKLRYKLTKVAIAAAGRSLKTGHCRVNQDIDAQLEIDQVIISSLEMSGLQNIHRQLDDQLNGKERFYCVGHSVTGYYLNNYPIANLTGHRGSSIGADVLATFLPDSVVNSLYAVLQRAGLEPVSLTLEPIAAIDIAIPEDLRTLNLALVDIGAGTSDIAITSDGSISAYGMVPVAGDKITEAIVEACLADFNTAEVIKRQLNQGQEITYKDILGVENTVLCQDIIETITPVLDQLAGQIVAEILKLNGSKSPKTVFCIGGGAQAPLLTEKIAERLELLKSRVAVRGRDMLKNVEKLTKDPVGGSDGITVLGIASVAYKKAGRDFITININNKDYNLFDSKELKVANALALVEYNPRDLVPHNGQNLCFILNGAKKQIYGELGQPAQIEVNHQPANVQTILKNKDKIKVTPAVRGADASSTLGALIVSENFAGDQQQIRVNGIMQPADYLIQPDDVIELGLKKKRLVPEVATKAASKQSAITVTVNGKQTLLTNLTKPILVDIFNFIDFDLSSGKGMLSLKINGQQAAYTSLLADGDVLELGWLK